MSYLFPYQLPDEERDKVLAKRKADEPRLEVLQKQLKEIEEKDGLHGEVWLRAYDAFNTERIDALFGAEVDVDAIKKIDYILENIREGVRKEAEKKERLVQGLEPLPDPEEEDRLRKQKEREEQEEVHVRKIMEEAEARDAWFAELLSGRDKLPAEELTVEVAKKLCGYGGHAWGPVDDSLESSFEDTLQDGQLDQALLDGMTLEERYDHSLSVLESFALGDEEYEDFDFSDTGVQDDSQSREQSDSTLASTDEAHPVLPDDDTKTLTPDDDASTIASDDDNAENASVLKNGSRISVISKDAKTLVADDRSIASKSINSVTPRSFKRTGWASNFRSPLPPPPGSGGNIRNMRATDLFKFGACNLDPLTETYQPEFYLDYLSTWPDCCFVVENPDGGIDAYLLGKIESSPFYSTPTPYDPDTNTNENYLPWHAHITALTVASHARQSGWGTKLSQRFEEIAEQYNCWFVDLFVRSENKIAITLYKKLGYTVFKRVVDYYADGEDAFDMRKPLSRDKDLKHIRENGEDIHVDPENVW